MFVISLFARNGFYVVLDNQLNDDPTLINSGESVWLGYWRQIATAVAADPYAVNKVIIDPLNVSTCSHSITAALQCVCTCTPSCNSDSAEILANIRLSLGLASYCVVELNVCVSYSNAYATRRACL